MSRMSELDAEVQRLRDLEEAVVHYLTNLADFENGRTTAMPLYWRERMVLLTVAAFTAEVQ